MMTADLLREKFLSFFESQKHKIVESDSLVPAGDPTVLFTPAGMNQFKNEFLGYDSGFKRAATSQRCLRTDDLEKVGKTAVHHTFFEMLGNFSFGDYFKEEAISWAWEFLTQELKIPALKLWVSVYQDDDEAYGIWKDKIKVPSGRIVKLGDKENFWPSEAKKKGPNGPCGPCSEIFYDFGKGVGCGEAVCDPSCSCGRFAEIWNLVFTQFNRKEGGTLEPLPNKNIDTGMGLERLAAVMQGAKNNFETDLFKPLVEEIISDVGRSAQLQLVYAVSDHVRAVVFSIYDGVLPSNDGRGYVVRKIIRKSILHLMALGIKGQFLYKLVPVVALVMHKPYPELKNRQENISQIILSEEKSFLAALNSSAALFKEKFKLGMSPENTGIIAFGLYDTYGIPWELTKKWLDENKIAVSEDDFLKELKQQKERSKAGSAMKGDVFSDLALHLDLKETKFSGYKEEADQAKILKIIQGTNEVKKITQGQEASIILDNTCFYAESGGQLGDTGEITKGSNVFEVLDTKKSGKVIIHSGRLKEGSLEKSDAVTAKINSARRLSIARNHTATHLLQAALRKVLGAHIKQQGSLVAEDRLRFDFTHFQALSDEELSRVEETVNNYILEDFGLEVKEMAKAQAKKSGALAFFAEKYEEDVRVVSIADISKEFCGGTHLKSSGKIGLFKITQESSIASGIRRIEAVTGGFAYQAVKNEEAVIGEVASMLNVPVDRVAQELEKRLSRIRELEKRLENQKQDILKNSLDSLLESAKPVNGKKLITQVMENADMDFLRKTVDALKIKTDNAVIALAADNQGRALLVVGLTPDLVSKGLDAVKLINSVSRLIGGSGGGRTDFAQAGGKNPEKLREALKELEGKL